MSDDTTADLQDLIEKLRHGDESAREALLDRVYHRLRRIAGLVLHEDFERLERVTSSTASSTRLGRN